MKQISLALVVFFSLISCGEKEKKDPTFKEEKEIVVTEKKQEITKKKGLDTVFNYWEVMLDTVVSEKETRLLDHTYQLKAITYSLNDSAIVRDLGAAGDYYYLDHAHTVVSDLLLRNTTLLDTKRMHRSLFEIALMPDFYAECNLFATTIDSIINNKIYLNSDFAIPDTDNQWRVWYSMQINNEKLDSLLIRDSQYIGL